MPPYRPAELRFWEKVQKSDNCWLWTGTKTLGYGKFWNGRKQVFAHRFVYELMVGDIPTGLQIDHLCRNRACVNPSHLEVVSQHENIRRGDTTYKTQCRRGHVLTPDNVLSQPSRKHYRTCAVCRREYLRLWKRKRDDRSAA